MPKCIELLQCDWLISNLCYQAIEQVYLIKWPVSVYIYIYIYTLNYTFWVLINTCIYSLWIFSSEFAYESYVKPMWSHVKKILKACSTWSGVAQNGQCMTSKYREGGLKALGSICSLIALVEPRCHILIILCNAASSRTHIWTIYWCGFL